MWNLTDTSQRQWHWAVWKAGLGSGRLTGILAQDRSAGQVERGPGDIANSRFLITLKSWGGVKEISVKCLIYIFLRVDSDCSCFLTSAGLCMCVTSRRCLYVAGSHPGRWQSEGGQGVTWRHRHSGCGLSDRGRRRPSQARQAQKNAQKQADSSVSGWREVQEEKLWQTTAEKP